MAIVFENTLEELKLESEKLCHLKTQVLGASENDQMKITDFKLLMLEYISMS